MIVTLNLQNHDFDNLLAAADDLVNWVESPMADNDVLMSSDDGNNGKEMEGGAYQAKSGAKEDQVRLDSQIMIVLSSDFVSNIQFFATGLSSPSPSR